MAKKETKKAEPLPVPESQGKNQALKNPVVSTAKAIKEIKKPIDPLIYSLIVTGVFFIIVLFGLIHHEMWRDELQAWLLARDSNSIPQLLRNMRYDGHPALWHSFLFVITRFTHNPVYMQGLHLIFACGFIFIFNRYSEIEIPYKIMFSFGYFALYEYSVISRSYVLLLLLMFIVCALYKNRYAHYILIGIALALLANVTIHGVIFAVGVSGVLFLDYFYFQKDAKKNPKTFVAGLAIALAGIVFSFYQIIPQKDNTFYVQYPKGLFEFDRWSAVFSRLFTTYFYIPKTDEVNFWNTNIYYDSDPMIQQPLMTWACLSIMAFILSLIIFIRKPLILLLYAGVTMGLLLLYYYTDLLFIRYCGFLLVILIACYWLEKDYPEEEIQKPHAHQSV